jgi:hypothetical protein
MHGFTTPDHLCRATDILDEYVPPFIVSLSGKWIFLIVHAHNSIYMWDAK